MVDLEAVGLAEMRDQALAAERLAGFGPAELERRPFDRRAAEIVVEADDAEDFRLGEVERLGDRGNRRVVDIAESFLQSVQDGQGGAGFRAHLRDHSARLGVVPRRFARHLAPS